MMNNKSFLVTCPSYYSRFFCISSRCELTCCAGWKISIDKPSLKAYKKVKGDFGSRLQAAINEKGMYFKSQGGRCPMLSKQQLCDIYTHMGKSAMCRTCRTYPRHVEDYGILHEKMLTLSCPEAARHILMNPAPITYETQKKAAERLAFMKKTHGVPVKTLTMLLHVRDSMFSILRNEFFPLELRLLAILALARDVQRNFSDCEKCIGLGRHYETWFMTPAFVKRCESLAGNVSHTPLSENMEMYLEMLLSLEVVTPQWPSVVEEGLNIWRDCYGTLDNGFVSHKKDGTYIYRNFAEHMLYMYVCGAVYDRDVYTKVKLAVFSVLIIDRLNMARSLKKDWPYPLILLISLYSRQLDHSDTNLEAMEQLLARHKEFSLAALARELMGGLCLTETYHRRS